MALRRSMKASYGTFSLAEAVKLDPSSALPLFRRDLISCSAR